MESRGLAARKIGDNFTSDGGDDMTYEGIEFFPASGGYKSEEEFSEAVALW